MANTFMIPTIESLFKIDEKDQLQSISTIIIFVTLAFLSLTNNIKNLKFSAYYGFYSIIAMVLGCLSMIAYNSYIELRVNSLYFEFNYFELSSLALSLNQVSIVVLSFSFHTYTFSIYETIEKPTTKKMMICTSVGILLSMMIYLMIGGIIYISYGEMLRSQPNVVSVINKSSFGIFINIAFSINVIMSFPMSFFSVKSYTLYVLPLIWSWFRSVFGKEKESHSTYSKELHEKRQSITSNNSLDKLSSEHEFDQCYNAHENNDEHETKLNEENHNANHSSHTELPYIVNLITTLFLFGLITIICFKLGDSKYVSEALLTNIY